MFSLESTLRKYLFSNQVVVSCKALTSILTTVHLRTGSSTDWGHSRHCFHPPCKPMVPCLDFLPVFPFTLLNSLTALGKDDFLEANRVWYDRTALCSATKLWRHLNILLEMKYKWFWLGRVLKMSHLELIQDNTKTNMKINRRQSPKRDHQSIWKWHLETFALTRFPLWVQNFTYIPKMDCQTDAVSFFPSF